MDRYRVDELMGDAKDVIVETYGAHASIKKIVRSKMSAFGAAVQMSGVLPAIAFYCNQDKPEAKKVVELLQGLYLKMYPSKHGELFDLVNQEIRNHREPSVTDDILCASVALKLSLNLFQLTGDAMEGDA